MTLTRLSIAALLALACSTRPDSRRARALPDSSQLVHLAQAALDSNRGGTDTLSLEVSQFLRTDSTVELTLRPRSRRVRGGGGVVLMDSTGRVRSVRGFQ